MNKKSFSSCVLTLQKYFCENLKIPKYVWYMQLQPMLEIIPYNPALLNVRHYVGLPGRCIKWKNGTKKQQKWFKISLPTLAYIIG